MGFFEKAKAFLRSERKKTAYLEPADKLRYILRYYWLWIGGIAGGAFLVIYILVHVFFTPKDYWFYGIFANTTAEAGNGSQLWKDFSEYAGFDTGEKKVEMNASVWFDPSVKGGTDNSYYQMFVAVTEAKDLDVLVTGTQALRLTGSSGRLLDLRRAGDAVITEKYADRLVYCDPPDESGAGSPVPVGIDVSDSLLVTKYHLYEGDCALGLGAYTKRPRSALRFLSFILDTGEGSEPVTEERK